MVDLLTVENAIALLTLTALEIVLGIDNIIFLTIVTGKLEPAVQARARTIGLALAMIMRIALLLAIGWVMTLRDPLFAVWSHQVTGKDIVLILGGLFLIAKATYEIHDNIEGAPEVEVGRRAVSSLTAAIVQVVLLDLVFSLDSVITAVGMVQEIAVMVLAIVIAVVVMMMFAGSIGRFVERHPTFKILALAFLLLVGVMLVVEGCGKHVEKGYIYFALGFSLAVELLNLKIHRARRSVAA